jgi:hypothetical protein
VIGLAQSAARLRVDAMDALEPGGIATLRSTRAE